MSEPDRIHFHEAAHATVALALGVSVRGISLERHGAYVRGVTTVDPSSSQLVILIAGMVGEALLYGEASYDPDLDDGFNDTTLLAHLPKERTDALANEAAEILRANETVWYQLARIITGVQN